MVAASELHPGSVRSGGSWRTPADPPPKKQEGGGGWGLLRRRQPLAGKSSPTPAQGGRGPLSPGGWGSPRSRSRSGQAAHHVQICCRPGRLDLPRRGSEIRQEMVPCLGAQGGARSRVSSFYVPSSQRPGHWHSPQSCSAAVSLRRPAYGEATPASGAGAERCGRVGKKRINPGWNLLG